MNALKFNLRCIKYVNLHNVHKKIQFKEVSWFCRNIKKQFIMSHPRLLRNIIVIELRLEQRQKKKNHFTCTITSGDVFQICLCCRRIILNWEPCSAMSIKVGHEWRNKPRLAYFINVYPCIFTSQIVFWNIVNRKCKTNFPKSDKNHYL